MALSLLAPHRALCHKSVRAPAHLRLLQHGICDGGHPDVRRVVLREALEHPPQRHRALDALLELRVARGQLAGGGLLQDMATWA